MVKEGNNMDKNREIVIAAIQMEAEMGDVSRNLKIVERLSSIAFKKGADLVLLPEFFSSATAFHPKMLSAISQFKGEPFKLLLSFQKNTMVLSVLVVLILLIGIVMFIIL